LLDIPPSREDAPRRSSSPSRESSSGLDVSDSTRAPSRRDAQQQQQQPHRKAGGKEQPSTLMRTRPLAPSPPATKLDAPRDQQTSSPAAP
jgi:hypothetical protein